MIEETQTIASPAAARHSVVARTPEPTLWGLSVTSLHDRFWEACGFVVVRRGLPLPPQTAHTAYLLCAPEALVLFDASVATTGSARQRVSILQIEDESDGTVRERVVANAEGGFLRIDRLRERPWSDLSRVTITTGRHLAEFWSSLTDSVEPWPWLLQVIAADQRTTKPVRGLYFDRRNRASIDAFGRRLASIWERPGDEIEGLERFDDRVWKQPDADVARATRMLGSVWIGTGHRIPADAIIAGPAVLWDNLDAAPAPRRTKGQRQLNPTKWVERPIILRRRSLLERTVKRTFDILFSLFALAVTLPVYPIVMLAICLEDGRPFFFGHRREMMHGREFTCWKFRSMRKNAEEIKARLKSRNLSNGPHFYMANDPRMTRVGRLIRKLYIDELPQFINVLLGHMSVVGPRPSPYSENQGCATWREARLSVRPGITGLWQVKRTRQVGSDFQEWVQYDLAYVETGGLLLDLKIILQTIIKVLF